MKTETPFDSLLLALLTTELIDHAAYERRLAALEAVMAALRLPADQPIA